MYQLHVVALIDGYHDWHDAFAQAEPFRTAAGVTAYRVTQDVDDPGKVYVDLDFSAQEQAENFIGVLETIWSSPQSRCVSRGHDRPQVREIRETSNPLSRTTMRSLSPAEEG
ncbi:MAG: hypothetical protein SW127_17245 [Actinomycetota bacterium]|nr:hypothetical protein [Actinomycetota bacterium]